MSYTEEARCSAGKHLGFTHINSSDAPMGINWRGRQSKKFNVDGESR